MGKEKRGRKERRNRKRRRAGGGGRKGERGGGGDTSERALIQINLRTKSKHENLPDL